MTGIRNGAGELVGLSSVGLMRLPGEGRPYYAYRMFLRRQDRAPYLMRTVANATRDFLRDVDSAPIQAAGMLIVTENRKLMRAGMRRYFERHGYRYRGRTHQGLDVWVAEFTNTPSVKTIPSWDAVPGNDGRLAAEQGFDPLTAKDALDQLAALGYIDKPDG